MSNIVNVFPTKTSVMLQQHINPQITTAMRYMEHSAVVFLLDNVILDLNHYKPAVLLEVFLSLIFSLGVLLWPLSLFQVSLLQGATSGFITSWQGVKMCSSWYDHMGDGFKISSVFIVPCVKMVNSINEVNILTAWYKNSPFFCMTVICVKTATPVTLKNSICSTMSTV